MHSKRQFPYLKEVKMKNKILFFILIAILAFFISVQAQKIDLKRQPGYVDLEKIKIPNKAGKTTEISLGPALLKIATHAAQNGDKKLTETLSELFSIQVKSFEIDSAEAEKIRPIMDQIEEKLNNEKWQRLIRVKEEDELTNISIKYDKDRAVGLMIMSVAPGREATFINIVGKIDLNKLGNLTKNLDIPALDSLQKSIKD